LATHTHSEVKTAKGKKEKGIHKREQDAKNPYEETPEKRAGQMQLGPFKDEDELIPH